MPLRPLLFTLVTVAIALLAITLWMQAVRPMLSHAPTTTQPVPPDRPVPPERALHLLFRGTVALAFMLVCLLLLVGLWATLREWLGRATPTRVHRKSTYTDAWKMAADRMDPPGPPEESPNP